MQGMQSHPFHLLSHAKYNVSEKFHAGVRRQQKVCRYKLRERDKIHVWIRTSDSVPIHHSETNAV